MRASRPREFYIPAGATKVADKQSDAVAYLYADRQSRLCARVFYGKQGKPVASCYFPTIAAREDTVTRLFESRRKVAERKAASRAFRHTFRVGDIFRCSWGYDQTNVDYYECTGLIGDTMLEVRRIDSAISDGDGWTGTCAPLPGQFSAGAKPMRVRAREGGFRVSSYSWARFIEPKMVAGVPTYGADAWTAYA